MPTFLSGQIKGFSAIPKDSPESQVLLPSGVCVTPDPWTSTLSEPGVSSLEALLRGKWAWLLRGKHRWNVNTFVDVGEWRQGQAQGPLSQSGVGESLCNTQGLEFLLPQTDDQTTSNSPCLGPSNA